MSHIMASHYKKTWGFIKGEMSSRSLWAGRHPPTARIFLSSVWPACQVSGQLLRRVRERNPHRYPVTILSSAHRAVLFLAQRDLLGMRKVCWSRLLCT